MSSAASGVEAEPFKLALCQLKVTEDKEGNIANAVEAVKEAASNGAAVVVLPEMWNCPYSNDSFPKYAEVLDSGDSPSTKALAELAKDLSIYIIGGSIPERLKDRLYNTCCVFSPEGEVVAKYRKCHLFDIDIPGKITFKESDTLTGGDALTVVDTRYGKFGIGICYDMRFPEMAMIYANRGVQMIVYPGAFNMVTGPVHWQLLQQARAVDNQLYVASCSPARDETASYTAWGHSQVIGPFAEVVASTEEKPGIVYADIDLKEVQERRQNMPLSKQRRADLYDLMDCRNSVGFKF
ncbi:omega-amidase [Chloropicon primus]|uniref:Omega-amidase n=1 Tax=Chloropicon primus TaxID=1764295 RepID=A0A5B8MLC2_9CHLO|nr:omega-amidase [Chloropicon primus]UPR00305.1 omega-amidase [Chloropicon primus]|eukprot:QDZ21091.1 omega-amidase [Chloropicon primus]